MTTVLVIGDASPIVRTLQISLHARAYAVHAATTAIDGVRIASRLIPTW